MNFKFILSLLIILLCSSVSASVMQGASGIQVGNVNSHQEVFNIAGTANLNPSFITTNENYNFNNDPSVSGLDVGTVDETILVYPGEVITYTTFGRGSFSLRSGSPVAVYTIITETEKNLLESSESMLTYDPYYHRFDHGVISPMDIFPKFTTKCKLIPSSESRYIVVDNRYFGQTTMVEITSEY
jgi:hypothetical protein